jgi:SAM-dependent methyltransferase
MINPSNFLNPPSVQVFQELFRFLSEKEYRLMYIQSLTNGYGLIHVLRTFLQTASFPTNQLLNLFAINKKIPISECKSVFSKDLYYKLLDKSVLTEENEKIYSSFQIIPVNYQFYLILPYRTFLEPSVYIGADSLSFNRLLDFSRMNLPKKVLDVATGSGYQLFSLPWQSPDISMVGLDINNNAVNVAKLNSLANKTSWINFENKDIANYKDQEELKQRYTNEFDLIIGNPPIIPTPDSLSTRASNKLHVDGGVDGLKVIKSFLPTVSYLLKSGGEAQFILSSLGTDKIPQVLPILKDLFTELDLSGRLIGVKKIPVELDSLYRGHKSNNEYQSWMSFYSENLASTWYRLILRIQNKKPFNFEYVESYRTDFSLKLSDKILKKQVLSKIEYSLVKIFPKIRDYSELEIMTNKLKEFIKSNDQLIHELSIIDFSKLIFQNFSNIFITEGNATRFWGLCIRNDWEAKFLERVKW